MASVVAGSIIPFIFSWTSLVVMAEDAVCVHMKYPNSDNFYDISFNMSMFQEFHSCLCEGSFAKCMAHQKEYAQDQYVVDKVSSVMPVVSSPVLNSYNCTIETFYESLACEQQHLQIRPDISAGNNMSQSFTITQSGYCSGCVILNWQSNNEKITFHGIVGLEDCGTNCSCRTTTAATMITQTLISQPTSKPAEPKTTTETSETKFTTPSAAITTVATSTTISSPPPTTTTTNKIPTLVKTTISTTTASLRTTNPTPSTSNMISYDDGSSATAANLGNKTSHEDTPVGLIIGVVIGGIVIIAATVIGVTMWRRHQAGSELKDKTHYYMDSMVSSEAGTRDLKSKNKTDSGSDTQSPSTGHSAQDFKGDTYTVPYKTKHQQDAIPTGISKNGTNFALLYLDQQHVDERNAPGHHFPRANSVSDQRSDFRKSDNNTVTKEDVNGNKSKQPKRNTAENVFNYTFAEEPPDHEKSHKRNFNISLSSQHTDFNKGGSSGKDYGYAGVYDLDAARRGDGKTTQNHDIETKRKSNPLTASVSNVRNSDRSSGTEDYGYSYIDQEFSKDSKATSATDLVNASGGRNSDYEYPVMENYYDFVSVNGNIQPNNNPGIMDTNIDDDYSTVGNECHSRKPTSDTSSNSNNVYAKLHEEKREMHNPYNSLLSPKEDPEFRKPIAIPSQNNLPTNHSARHSNVQPILNASSNGESDETVSVIDVPPSTNSQPMTNIHGANSDQNNGVHRIKPSNGDDEYAVVCKRKP